MGIKNLKQCFIEAEPDAFIGIPKAHIARLLFGWGKNTVKKYLTVTDANSGKISDLFVKLLGGCSLNALLKKYPSPQEKSSFTMVTLSDNEMAAILFTSGSTGSPKGVVYSHKMFEAQIMALRDDYAINPGERDLATFPLFSLFGPALGMASIVPDMDASKPINANPDYIFAAIEKYRCTNLFANPALIDVLGIASTASHQGKILPSLKRVISAGAPATLPSIARFSQLLAENVPILTSYGATESLPLTKIASKELLDTSAVTDSGGGICVGTPIKGVDINIIPISEENIDHWDPSLVLVANQIGEIVVKGDMVSEQYYHRDKATAQAKIIDRNDEKIIHRMGDLGYLDNTGQLWMCGRKAHRVETEQSVFYSIPCERIFNTHPQVKRTALVAVTINYKITPLICVELTDTAKANKAFNQTSLFADLKNIALANPKTSRISHYLLHDDFPVDIRHNAKIFREKLAVWAQNNLSL
jgi:acyl-CoA synthetase (AMP-forming)/AMP-acid ligase II